MNRQRMTLRMTQMLVLAAGLATNAPAQGAQEPADGPRTRTCRVVPPPGWLGADGGSGGGMNGDGWDGGGKGSFVLRWHMEGSTPDMDGAQRQALIAAMQEWASVVDVSFVEVPVPNMFASIDYHFLTGDHSNVEPHEANDPDCPFDANGGTLAHAGYPPDASGQCGGGSSESYAGNVHFDEMENWSTVMTSGDPGLDLMTVAVHEIGHALGLVHSSAPDIMQATFSTNEPYFGLSSNDISNIRSGYANGVGSISTLEQTGVWVDSDALPPFFGTPSSPFGLVQLGVAGVPPTSQGVSVRIDTGTYSALGGLVIDRNMILEAENGSVVVE